MPAIDDSFDEPPLEPQPPRTAKPAVPLPRIKQEAEEPPANPPSYSFNPLIPVQSLVGWRPDQSLIDDALSPGRPKG